MIQAAVAFAQPEHFGAAWSHFILRSRQRWHAGICAPSSAISNVHALMPTAHIIMEHDGRGGYTRERLCLERLMSELNSPRALPRVWPGNLLVVVVDSKQLILTQHTWYDRTNMTE